MRKRHPVFCTLAALATLPIGSLVASATASAAPGALASGSTAAPRDSTSGNFAVSVGPSTPQAAGNSCQLGNGVKHVFYIGFDNVHLRRDNANSVAKDGDDNRNTDLNIPSDLEQIPALYNFLRGTAHAGKKPHPSTANNANYADGRDTTYADGTPYPGGTLLSNNHTPLISHTSVDFTTSYTGVYGARHGIAVSQNSIGAYTGNPSAPVSSTSGFAYWTDPLGIGSDPTSEFVTKDSSGNAVNAPAPWVPYTRAGCDVGAVAATGFVLENAKSATDSSTSSVKLTSADEGIAVHCTDTAASICNLANTDTSVAAVPDKLPNEPGGYNGYSAMFGNEYVAPAINDRLDKTASAGSHDLQLLRTDTAAYGSTSSNKFAFPGFDSEDGNYTLGYTLAMQNAGIPVTFGYLSDAHDCHNYTGIEQDYGNTLVNGNCTYAGGATSGYDAFGSGEAGYENYLSQLNTDFSTFFQDAKNDGYTPANTEFVFYSDESDHAAEATPVNGTGPNACNGVTVACDYTHSNSQLTPRTPGELGEATVKLDNILPKGGSASTLPYFILADSAPDFYLEEPNSGSPPAPDDPAVRSTERTLAAARVTDPYSGASEPIADYLADDTELNALHMVTADEQRTPTFTAFAAPDDYVESGFPNDCGGSANNTCADSGFAYVHGDYAPETTTTWAGFVGPGVANLGTSDTWTDHTDLRPTLLALLGLHDDYASDGRVITQILDPRVVPPTGTTATATNLGSLLKALNAPVWETWEGANDGFGPATLVADTEAIKTDTPNDSTYNDITSRIATITAQRDSVVSDIQARLTGADAGVPIDRVAAARDEAAGACLLAYANQLKTYAVKHTAAHAPADCHIGAGALPAVAQEGSQPPALLVLAGGVVVAGGILLYGRRWRIRSVA